MELKINKAAFLDATEEDRNQTLSILANLNYLPADTQFVPDDGAPEPIDLSANHEHLIARPLDSPAYLDGRAIETFGLNFDLGGLKGYACDIVAATALAACAAGTSGVGLAFCTAAVNAGREVCKKQFG